MKYEQPEKKRDDEPNLGNPSPPPENNPRNFPQREFELNKGVGIPGADRDSRLLEKDITPPDKK